MAGRNRWAAMRSTGYPESQSLNWKSDVVDVVTAPSGTMSLGDRVAVGSTATGAFADQDFTIATYVGGTQTLAASYTFEAVLPYDVYPVKTGTYAGNSVWYTGSEWEPFSGSGGGSSSSGPYANLSILAIAGQAGLIPGDAVKVSGSGTNTGVKYVSVVRASATTDDQTGEIWMVISGADGSATPASGALIKLLARGITPAAVTVVGLPLGSPPTPGATPVYLSTSGRPDMTAAVGHSRVIGVLLSQSDTLGMIYWFSIEGLSLNGGGGGDYAPDTAAYLLNSDTVPGTITSAVAIQALASRLSFIRDLGSSTSGNGVSVMQVGVLTTGTLAVGSGVGINFNAEDTTGSFTYGEFTFKRNAGGTATDLLIAGVAGSELATLRAAAGLEPITLMFPLAVSGAISTRGGGVLYLSSATNAGVQVRANGHNVVKFTQAKQEFLEAASLESLFALTVKAAGLTLMDAGGQVGVVIDATDIEFDVAGKTWTMDSSGNLNCPNGELKTIANATADTSAPSWGQVKGYVSGASSKAIAIFGASTTGPNGEDTYSLQVGGGLSPANDCSLSYPFSTKFVATSDITITGFALRCDVGPTGGLQSYTLIKNGSLPSGDITLNAGAVTGVSGTLAVTGVAGDWFEIRAWNAPLCSPGAAGVMCYMQYTLS